MQSFDKNQARDFGELGQNLTLEIENSPKPVLAAVNGFALGGGVRLQYLVTLDMLVKMHFLLSQKLN